MRENILILLMDMFALIGKSDSPHRQARRKIEELFLRQTINDSEVERYLIRHDDLLSQELSLEERNFRILEICKELNQSLTQRQKTNAVFRMIEYGLIERPYDKDEYATLKILSETLNVSAYESNLMLGLIEFSDTLLGPDSLIVSSDREATAGKHIYRSKLEGVIRIVYIQSADLYFVKYQGGRVLHLNGVQMKRGRVYVFSSGAIIRGELMHPIYYSDVVACFRQEDNQNKIEFSVDKITYRFPDGVYGLRELSFVEQTGKLMGIMGGSGAGKSTLLNVLNGSAKPTTGKVTINGLDLYKDSDTLKGVVGFVSQDDLLMEDLTVYQNLYFNAELCFAGKDEDFIREKVEKVSLDLGLRKIRNLKVGTPLEKTISGGQRKRLNIALELIREPAVLILDEPTSGLSSKDSEVIIDLLKSLALRGTLVFVVIHQPSSQIFKSFDKLLLLDQGGYPVYLGNPVDAVIYFKHATHQINPDIGECVCCGNVNPEQIFSIMEVRQLDENGFARGDRMFSPKQWNKHFREQQELEEKPEPKPIPEFVNDYRKPGTIRQFGVFMKRDILSKWNNHQYVFITLLEAPVLAFLLAFLTRFRVEGMEYTFQDNRNMVSYIFMSVIVALFLGMTVSAEEILRDRKIRKRERFLNLSRASYLGSKVTILLGISALQALLFVVVGNLIMGFKEFYFEFWFMFLVLSLYANALGLNVSSAFKSAVTIYVLIPFLIIPQLMLSGLLVKFDELNPTMAGRSLVPWSGDIMATRWAFEGLTVKLYTQNSYQEPLYDLEKQKVNLSYYKNVWFYKMNELLEAVKTNNADSLLPVIQHEFDHLGVASQYSSIKAIRSGQAKMKLYAIRDKFQNDHVQVSEKLDSLLNKRDENGKLENNWAELKRDYFNDRLEDLVLSRDQVLNKIYMENAALHSRVNRVYFDPPEGQQIRAHLFAPQKYFLGNYYDTYWVNVTVILLMTMVLHVLLYFRVAEHFVKRVSNISILSRIIKK